MRVIIAGSRGFKDRAFCFERLDYFHRLYTIGAVVCGKAQDADTLGEEWALSRGVPVVSMPACWVKYELSAGHRRNAEMAAIGEYLIAFWDGRSPGTRGMVALAARKGIPTWLPSKEATYATR